MRNFEPTDKITINEMPKGVSVVIQYINDTLVITPDSFAKQHRNFTKEMLGDNVIFAIWNTETDEWFIHDIANINAQTYFTQKELYDFCIAYNFLCVDVKYKGNFISVDHCLSFLRNIDTDKIRGIWIKQDIADATNRITKLYTVGDNIVNIDEIKRMKT